jgi:hypothetical protein
MERTVNDAVAPALRDPGVRGLVSDYCVSKHGEAGEPNRGVWLSLFSPREAQPRLLSAVEPHLRAYAPTAPYIGDDPVLCGECTSYRRALTHMTEVALDLHTSPELRVHQVFLIGLACSGLNPRPVLGRYLALHSFTYARLCAGPEGDDEFWKEFSTWGPQEPLTYPGHWLWNIVVGVHPPAGGDPRAAATEIGILRG